jgi:hypothetical protein
MSENGEREIEARLEFRFDSFLRSGTARSKRKSGKKRKRTQRTAIGGAGSRRQGTFFSTLFKVHKVSKSSETKSERVTKK